MATYSLLRSFPKTLTLTSFLSRSLSSSTTNPALSRNAISSLSLLRPLAACGVHLRRISLASSTIRGFATRTTSSSLNDPNPNWSNRPPKETILLDGCDFEHWLVVMEKPEGDPTRDDIIDSYIKTLAMVVGSEEEARMKIYSVSTRCYFAFGALVSEELSYKIKDLPKVRWVLPDSYLDVRNKDYGGEPFIDGQAVPYDPKYHEEWIRNNSRANDRNRRNDRPRNFDRSRNFDRRPNERSREPNQTMQNPGPNMNAPPSNMAGQPPNNNFGPPNNNFGPPNNSMPPNNYAGQPNNYAGPPNNYSGPPNNYSGQPNNYSGPSNNMPPPNYSGPPNNMGGMPPNNMGGMPPNAGWSNNQNSYPPNRDMGGSGGNPYRG